MLVKKHPRAEIPLDIILRFRCGHEYYRWILNRVTLLLDVSNFYSLSFPWNWSSDLRMTLLVTIWLCSWC